MSKIKTGIKKKQNGPSVIKSYDAINSVSLNFPIVGIGASAGGLEALEQFFENMPENNGMAFVIIQHLDPNHVGIMPELLQRITPMKVVQASDRLKVKPNSVYVIPPNKSMSLLHGALHLFELVESHGLHLPIDIFFCSLAKDRQDKSIGIILSGMGSDGSLGLKAIKEKNGIVAVQEPASAKFDSMPRSAAQTVIADIVAPANELPEKLINYLHLIPRDIADTENEQKIKSNLDKIIILLREQSGHDFTLYKKTTLFRRIERRKSIHQIDKINHYVRFLQENPKEVEILFKELLIGVTSFFRDPAVWTKLKETILPELINELPDGQVLRAWVAGCSSGEEAYSLAIIFKEVLSKIKKKKKPAIQIFATDIDKDAIDKARKGVYPKNIETGVTPERIRKFFTIEGENYKVSNDIREIVIFAQQNIIKDPPFTKMNIVTCRNLLIYLEPELQGKLISLFNNSLNRSGVLLLGTAETLGKQNDGFKELDAKLKIFKHSAKIQVQDIIDFPNSFNSNIYMIPEKKILPKVENIQTVADQILLQRFAPPSVLVNVNGDIIYITGRTGKYLEPSAGKANLNIHAMARDGLRNALPGAFRTAIQNYDPVYLKNIKIENDGITHFTDVTLQRMENPETIRGMVMVVFNDGPSIAEPDMEHLKTGKRVSAIKYKKMEIELQRSNEENQSIREEMQTSQEELKSTNEELQSTNEELQSTNEELTTSKEEMQSLNEEMQTVNIELQTKVNDYSRINDDMKNLLNSTEIATLFLDKEMNVRRFTEKVSKIIKLRNTDIGRPFTELVSDLQYPKIDCHARQVLKDLISIETVIATNDKRWFIVRIMPYRTLDDRIDGLVITFIDITNAKNLEIELKKANEALLSNNKN